MVDCELKQTVIILILIIIIVARMFVHKPSPSDHDAHAPHAH